MLELCRTPTAQANVQLLTRPYGSASLPPLSSSLSQLQLSNSPSCCSIIESSRYGNSPSGILPSALSSPYGSLPSSLFSSLPVDHWPTHGTRRSRAANVSIRIKVRMPSAPLTLSPILPSSSSRSHGCRTFRCRNGEKSPSSAFSCWVVCKS